MKDLIIALDLPTTEAALELVDTLGEPAGWYKPLRQIGQQFVDVVALVGRGCAEVSSRLVEDDRSPGFRIGRDDVAVQANGLSGGIDA